MFWGSGVEGEHAVKRQTLILVVIGVVLFIAGGTIAFATVMSGTKTPTASTAAATDTPVVVAVANIPAGTTGQTMVAQGLVAIEPVAHAKYQVTDIPNLQSLTDEVLTASVTKGQALQSTQLSASTTSISLPKGDDGITITTSGVGGLAGYLQPGSEVDVYANIDKLSSGSNQANVPIPCTELAMSNVEVIDVSSIIPAYGNHVGAAERTLPTTVTLLLAVNPSQGRTLSFLSQNESLSVTQTQKGNTSVPVGQCIGTSQTTAAP
jgi:Flp pilus assembly protein CpaB